MDGAVWRQTATLPPRSVCLSRPAVSRYNKRGIVCDPSHYSQSYGEEHSGLSYSGQGEEDSEQSSDDDSTSDEEEDIEEPATPPLYTYARCPPSHSDAINTPWQLPIADSAFEHVSIRASDTASITSSRRSAGSKGRPIAPKQR
jgi:hypothetical protein